MIFGLVYSKRTDQRSPCRGRQPLAGPCWPVLAEVLRDPGSPEPDLCMGAGWWAVQGPGTNERTAMDPEPETQRSGANGEVISGTVARGGPTSVRAPTVCNYCIAQARN